MLRVEVMWVSLKTENEELSGMTMQVRGRKAGGALRLTLPCKSSVVIPGSPSARLTRCLTLNTGQWLLRFSVLRETHMTFAWGHFKKLKCCDF